MATIENKNETSFLRWAMTCCSAVLFLMTVVPTAARAEDDPNDVGLIWSCFEEQSKEATCKTFTDIFDAARTRPALIPELRRLLATDKGSCKKRRIRPGGAVIWLTSVANMISLGTGAMTESGITRLLTQMGHARTAEALGKTLEEVNIARSIIDARVGTGPTNLRWMRPLFQASKIAARVSGIALAAEILLTPTNDSLGSSLDQAMALDPAMLLQQSSAKLVCSRWIETYPHVRRAVQALNSVYLITTAAAQANREQVGSCEAKP